MFIHGDHPVVGPVRSKLYELCQLPTLPLPLAQAPDWQDYHHCCKAAVTGRLITVFNQLLAPALKELFHAQKADALH